MSGDQASAVRRKVEAWLAEPDPRAAIALRARPEWTDEPVLRVGGAIVRVVPCPTPLAARAALHDRADSEKLVLLTELTDTELGAGLLAHLSRHTVRSIDPWELVRQVFGGADLDPSLVRTGRWVAAALNDCAPADGWPKPSGKVLTRDHALRCLAGQLLGIDRQQIDSAGLLQWSTDAPAVMRFREVPAEVADGVSRFLAEIAGPAAVPVMAAVRGGHGVDALPVGLFAGLLWPASAATGPVAVAGRVRLEPRVGQLTDREATALREAAEAWLDRVHESDVHEARRMLGRAEALAMEIGVTDLLGGSVILPSGFTQRLRALAAVVRAAVPAGNHADPALVARAQELLPAVAEHRSADPRRVETARMAVRLLRWLSTADESAPATLYDALLRQVRADGWVDRARLDIFAGDPDPQVAEAYQLLHRAVDARRARHDRQFAELLAVATGADAQPGALRVEDVLDRVVQPILDRGRRVLLLVMDGMSVAAATELAESLTRNGSWLEVTPGGGPRVGVLAALPTITEVSRCSLLSGRIAVGTQTHEVAAFTQRFPGALLLHKSALRAGAGSALDAEVTAALADPDRGLVAAVVNTIDDALDRSDPGTIVWTDETIVAVRDLLSLAQDRVVVLVSDHGHVVDRGPEAVQKSTGTSENRWRPADGPAAGDGEVLVQGSRVAKAGGRVVLPWREDLRYGPRKAGYHGGAAPAEAVIPLVVLSAGVEDAVPGWAGAPVASPDWWREPLPVAAPPAAPPAPTRRNGSNRPAPQSEALFDAALATPPAASPPPAAAAMPAAPAPGRPALVAALLGSEVYQARRRVRAPLPDERVAALLEVLIASGGRATMETLAARAGIPAHRIHGSVTELMRLLQVEGYPVLTVDPDGQTVKLDTALLKEQFQL